MFRPLATLGTVLLLALTALSISTPAQADKPDRLPAQASPQAAQQALERAAALFAGGGERERGRSADHAHGREATLVLRDLAVALPRLSGEDRRQAEAILARPTDGAADPQGDGYQPGTPTMTQCTDSICVHWVETTVDAVPLTDDSGNGRPDYVDSVLSAMGNVHDTFMDAGYRPPLSDGVLGGNAKTDIYLADIGDQGLYGYCTTDENPHTDYTTWAYCVLDDDYAAAQFGTANTALENMRVTAAHEYFHAIQFAYDFLEDGWFMEATATWAEDELYDSVNDNVFYLRGSSPLSRPWIPVDTFDPSTGHHYGSWIFFRYLTEQMRTSQAGMPTLVRDMWRRVDARPGARDEYSMQAVRAVLAQRNADWTKTFTRFAEAGRRSRQVYDEGRAQKYPVAPLWGKVTLSPSRPGTNWGALDMNHLTSATVRFTPNRKMTHRRWKLRLQVNMAPRSRGSAAIATVHHRRKAPTTQLLRLNRKGDGVARVPFTRRKVKAVELTLVNTSTRMNCWVSEASPYSCLGYSKDDNLRQQLRGVAFR